MIPITVRNQILVIRENKTMAVPSEPSILKSSKNPNIVISVVIIPPGKNDKVPIVIGTNEIIVVSKNDKSILNAKKLK